MDANHPNQAALSNTKLLMRNFREGVLEDQEGARVEQMRHELQLSEASSGLKVPSPGGVKLSVTGLEQ